MSQLSAERIVEEFKRAGVTHAVGLPDNGSRALFERLTADEAIDLVAVTREGEAFAIASGLYIGGKLPVVIIQNTGFLESGDALRGTAHNMEIPLVMLIGYRGYGTLGRTSGRVDSAAVFFEPTLKAWKIPYTILEKDEDLALISRAFQEASERGMPVAVIYPGETV